MVDQKLLWDINLNLLKMIDSFNITKIQFLKPCPSDSGKN